MLRSIKKYLSLATGLLWPETCPFCGKVRPAGSCKKCERKLEQLRITEPACMRCGKPVEQEEQEYCHDCRNTLHYYDKGASLWVHKAPVSTSVYQFKYHNQRIYGAYYAKELLKCHAHTIKAWNPDIIIPIPLHIKRKKKRGYNQSELLAKEIGKRLQIPVFAKMIVRVRNTRPQKQVKHSERRSNIRNAFSLSQAFRPVKTVLLIDDIYTTGNTINEAARILWEAGVQNIYFLTISIGQGN